MRFIHAADIHLDSPLKGLPNYPEAPTEAVRRATRDAFKNLIDLAIKEQIDFLLIAGDLYDGELKNAHAGMHVAKAFARLDEAGIPVVIIRGNHDAENKVSMEVELPSCCHILSADEPQSVELLDGEVVVHGQSFAKVEVTEDLSASYPPPVASRFNIGLLHTNANGSHDHDTYARCSVEALKKHGYDYWALGHIHIRQVLSENPWIIYPGNLQGRHIKESGSKGATLVTVEDNKVINVEHRDLDVARWVSIEVDAAGADTKGTVLGLVKDGLAEAFSAADGRILAARVTVVGQCEAHAALAGDPSLFVDEVRTKAFEVSQEDILIEKVNIRTTPETSAADSLAGDAVLSGVLATFDNLPEELLAEIAAELEPLREKLDATIKAEVGEVPITDPLQIKEWAKSLDFMVLQRISDETDGVS